ncbi:hypothetical protein [Paraburkholderia hospita]|nr:hypothetical protein [Paraburkholderia hospita]
MEFDRTDGVGNAFAVRLGVERSRLGITPAKLCASVSRKDYPASFYG